MMIACVIGLLTLGYWLGILLPMKTLETDIEVHADGSLKLLAPMPHWLKPGRSHVLLVMAEAGSNAAAACAGVESAPDVCGGDACIASTRVPVWSLEQARRLGFSEDELLDAFPSLQRGDLRAAWDYVRAHTGEIDKAIRENEEA